MKKQFSPSPELLSVWRWLFAPIRWLFAFLFPPLPMEPSCPEPPVSYPFTLTPIPCARLIPCARDTYVPKAKHMKPRRLVLTVELLTDIKTSELCAKPGSPIGMSVQNALRVEYPHASIVVPEKPRANVVRSVHRPRSK